MDKEGRAASNLCSGGEGNGGRGGGADVITSIGGGD